MQAPALAVCTAAIRPRSNRRCLRAGWHNQCIRRAVAKNPNGGKCDECSTGTEKFFVTHESNLRIRSVSRRVILGRTERRSRMMHTGSAALARPPALPCLTEHVAAFR